ncbi:hypothetical protein KJ605_02055 [Patescibacteria group bacterium]|nr:hypothetical protein [Patescibacteria group bacterium]MBU1970535.1 hypothetical protein [Patescibacteria group bacterium]
MSKNSWTIILESWQFWLFAFFTFVVLLELIFFPHIPDFWELILIIGWRILAQKTPCPQKVLLGSVITIVLLMPLLLIINQPDPAKELAVWLLYILLSELGLQVWEIIKPYFLGNSNRP